MPSTTAAGRNFTPSKRISIENVASEETAGIDLGISNYSIIDSEDGFSELYSGNVMKEYKRYFTREECLTEGESGPSKRVWKVRRNASRRKCYFRLILAEHIVQRCVKKIAVGGLSHICEYGTGNSRNGGRSRSKKLHIWDLN